jgi:hypothetical protein
MSNELDQEQVILKNHVIAGSYLIAAMYKLKRLRWKSKNTIFCHSGESRNPVFSIGCRVSGLRFSPE